MKTIYNINHKWAFSKESTDIPTTMPTHWVYVNLPYTWNGIDGQDGGGDYYRGTCLYAKEIMAVDLPQEECLFLEINGANSSADVYWNGEHLAHHDGGYSSWRIELTGKVEVKNLLVIAVDNSPNDYVYPQQADFTFYGGLYRDVKIISVEKTHFELLYYGSKGIKATPILKDDASMDAALEVEAYVVHQADATLAYGLYDANHEKVAFLETKATKIRLDVENVHRWQGKKDPYLYTLEVELWKEDVCLDRVETKIGFRTFAIDPQQGFFLNGISTPLHGAARHQDRPDKGNALSYADHKEDIDLLLDMGANTVRLAHYQHDQAFYDLCDETGLIVWAEIPYISAHMPNGKENTISQMTELIIQNYHHPSIVVWGLSNEISMKGSDDSLLENHRLLNDLCHELDPSRKTVVAVLSSCSIDDPYLSIPDALSYNHYYGWYGGTTDMNGEFFDDFHAKYPDRPIGMSEYGCEALDWHTSDPKQGDYTEEYQAHYHEELIKQLFTRPYLWATHVWNMFDFAADARNEGGENGMNHKGLVTFDRQYKKDAFYAYKAWLSEEPFVHICGKRYVDRVEKVTKVTVYSNQEEVELFVNGQSLGKQTSDVHFFYYDVPNEGVSHVVALAGDCKDEATLRKVDTFNEAYRLKEAGAVLNWFDIETPEGYYSLNDTIEELLKSEEGKAFVLDFVGGLAKQMGMEANALVENNDMMKMLSGFTLLRLTNMMGMMGTEALKKDTLLAMNRQLNQIPKEKL